MRYFCILLFLMACLGPVQAEPEAEPQVGEHHHGHGTHALPDDHAPIGVMGEHRHAEGEWMASYRFRTMHMDGNLNGSSEVSDRAVLNRYMVTPTEMTMNAHMLGLMYGANDDVTVMLGIPFVNKSMDHLTRRGGRFTTNSSGLGDIKVSALVNLYENEGHHLHFNAGVSLPTGAVDVRDTTPAGPNMILPYPMQLGSGTLDLMPGMTYSGHSGEWSWGAQVLGTIRMGSNKRGYTLGNEGELSVWGAKRWNDTISTSVRLNGRTWGDISGADPALNPRMIPTADPTLRAGSRVDALLGLNSSLGSGHRLSIEGGVPIVQSLDGPQLGVDYILTAGWQLSF